MMLTVSRNRLPNGLTLLAVRNPKLPLVALSAFVIAGKDQNPPGRAGTASLAVRLLDEGTQRYDAHQISDLLETLGASTSSFSDRELSAVSLQLRSSELSTGMELLGEMLRRPLFRPELFERELRRIRSHVAAMNDDPETVGSQLLNAAIYQGTPLQFPVLGTVESLAEMTVEEVRAFHARTYGPQNTFIVAAGDLETPDLLDLAERHFGSWSNPLWEHLALPSLARQTRPDVQVHPMDKEQLTIFLGHLGIARSNPDYYALQVMDVILGGGPGFASRIPRKLRDEQGLAYSTFADLTGSSGNYPGRFVAFISTSPTQRENAVEGLLREIRSIREQGVTSEELEMAQDFLTGSFVFEFQSNSSIARFLISSELFGLPDNYLEEYPRLIRSISREDVVRVARQYLDTINYTTILVGPI